MKKYNFLNISGLAFLVLSLIAVTITVSDPLKKQLIGAFARYSPDALIRQRERRGGCEGAGCLAPEIISNRENESNQVGVAKEILDIYDKAVAGDTEALAQLKEKNAGLAKEVEDQLKEKASEPQATEVPNLALENEQRRTSLEPYSPSPIQNVQEPTSGIGSSSKISSPVTKATPIPLQEQQIPTQKSQPEGSYSYLTGTIATPQTPQNIITDKRSNGARCEFSSTCQSGYCAGTCQDKPTSNVVNNYADCNRPGLTPEQTKSCNQSLTSLENTLNFLSFGGLGNYASSFSPEKVKFAWQNLGYSSADSCKRDYPQGISRNVGCDSIDYTKEQLASSVKLGTTAVAESALLATGVGLTTGAISLPVALSQGLAVSTVAQTGSAASTCLIDPKSQRCLEETAYAALSWVNVGTLGLAPRSVGNAIISGVNLGVDVIQGKAACSGENASAFGCSFTIGAGLLDVGGAASPLIPEKLLINTSEADASLARIFTNSPTEPKNIAAGLTIRVSPEGEFNINPLTTDLKNQLTPERPGLITIPSQSKSLSVRLNEINEKIVGQPGTFNYDDLTNGTTVTLKPGDKIIIPTAERAYQSPIEFVIPQVGKWEVNNIGEFARSDQIPYASGYITQEGITFQKSILKQIEIEAPDGKFTIIPLSGASPKTPTEIVRVSPEPGVIKRWFKTIVKDENGWFPWLRSPIQEQNMVQLPSKAEQEEVKKEVERIAEDPAFKRFQERATKLKEANKKGVSALSEQERELAILRSDYTGEVSAGMDVKQREYGRAARAARALDQEVPRLRYDKLSEIVLSIPNESISLNFDDVVRAADRYDFPGSLKEVKSFINSKGGSVTRRELIDFVADNELNQLAKEAVPIEITVPLVNNIFTQGSSWVAGSLGTFLLANYVSENISGYNLFNLITSKVQGLWNNLFNRDQNSSQSINLENQNVQPESNPTQIVEVQPLSPLGEVTTNDTVLELKPLYNGAAESITYSSPEVRNVEYHVIRIDMSKIDKFVITPPQDRTTTSTFLDKYNVQIAINGDGWRYVTDEFGNTVREMAGFNASEGNQYGPRGQEQTLYIDKNNHISLERPPNGEIWNAISFPNLLVKDGVPVPHPKKTDINPRTALGITKDNVLILITVDGKEYSKGMTQQELTNILIEQGAVLGVNFDGGTSSTMVIEGPDGKPVIVNKPDTSNASGESTVANHLGIQFLP